MNGSIAKYFKSPKIDEQKKDEGKVEDGLPSQESLESCSSNSALSEDGPSKPSKSEVDRMIAENMASVLKSLKKKRSHRCSKRRRNGEHKEKNDLSELKDDETVVEEKEARRQSPRKSTQEKSSESKESSNLLKEKPIPTKEKLSLPEQPKEGKENMKINAFQLMMSSRNKAIGSNSPGKDGDRAETTDATDEQKRNEKVKRKLKLEAWAERKGGSKRKLQEEAEEEFIAHQMNRRAKRLKKLIENMDVAEDVEESVEVVEPPPKVGKLKIEKKEVEPTPRVQLKLNAKRGRRRLSSNDSTQSSVIALVQVVEESPVKKSEDEVFVEQLSSPIKKKDSLLGYFNKVGKDTPSPEVVPKEKSPVPKRRSGRLPAASRPSLEVVQIVEEELAEKPNENDTSFNTSSSGRPRRSCAGKIKDYAVFGGTSPEKETTTKRSGKKPIADANSPPMAKAVKSAYVRSIDQDASETPKSTRNVKLAPLFMKKPVEDPEKVRARQEFLMSGIPEKMRLEIEKQRTFEESILNESPVFPLISHVQQLTSAEKNQYELLATSKIKILAESPEGRRPCGKKAEFEFASLTNCDDSDVEDILAKLIDRGSPDKIYNYKLPEVTNVKGIVREWKQLYKHFPVFKCYKQFRLMYEEHVEVDSPPGSSRPVRKVAEEIILENSIEFVEPKYSFLNGELLFTEKYKPLNLEHILINCQPAIALKKFLSSWKEDRSNNPYDSEDDFENSNSSVSSNSTSICNHVVLVGPPGCGKTCNVYAVASEMDFNVLELNASSRRKGKIILQELQEATQSHQVRRKDETIDMFKKTLNRKGSKAKHRKQSTDSDGGPSSSKKLSLILIEDADIVFDQDEGFVTAINQLISTSKRPIVLTTTDPNCTHLTRYIANNVIRYVAAGISNVAKLLSLLALVEKVHMDQSNLARLYAFNRKDLRKTINELQFFIQSGGDRDQLEVTAWVDEPPLRFREDNLPSSMADDEASVQSNASSNHSDGAPAARMHSSLFRLFSRNQNELQLIQAPLNFDNLWCNMERVLQREEPPATGRKRRKKSKAEQGLEELNELVFFYENVSSAALIQRDSQDVKDRLVEHLEEEMAHGLVEESWESWFEGELNPNVEIKRRSGVGAMCYDSLKQFDADDRQIISSYIGINSIRTRSTYCDYEPYLRTICRYERERSRLERRGSRFYHYFRNFINANPPGTGTPMVTNFSVDHFDALSSRFEEDHIPAENPGTTIATAESSDESR